MKCKLCEQETDVYIEVNEVDYFICEDCCVGIYRHMSKAYTSNRTVFDISKKKERKPVERHPEIAAEVLNYLYKNRLKSARPEYKPEKIPEPYLNLISARVNDGHTIEELKAVVYFKHKEWRGTDMHKYLRADTLFRRSNFGKYLAENAHKIPKMKAVTNTNQRALIKELNSYGVQAIVNEETDRLAKELMKTGYQNKQFLNMYLIDKI